MRVGHRNCPCQMLRFTPFRSMPVDAGDVMGKHLMVLRQGAGMFAQEIVGHIGAEKQTTLFMYDEDDPYAVTLIFRTPDDEALEWVFARSLVTEALDNEVSGMGDVRCSVEATSFVLRLTGAENASTVIKYPLDEVGIFHDQTARMVPPGEEVIDIAAELGRWLDGETV